jgi:hypothetical protein
VEETSACLRAGETLTQEGLAFSEELVKGVLQRKSELDSLIEKLAPAFPVEQMPLPPSICFQDSTTTYAVDALRKVMILGVEPNGVILELLILVIISIATILVGVPLFDRAVRK